MFFNSGLAVNKEVYITKCLPVLDTFIKKHHQHDEVVFWPDLASAHYAKDTLADLQKKANRIRVKGLQPAKCSSTEADRKLLGYVEKESIPQ